MICTAHQIFSGDPTRNRWAWHVARTGNRRVAYRILVGRNEEKRTLGKPKRRREDNIEMDLKKSWMEGMDSIGLP